jgi:hypothetical protein
MAAEDTSMLATFTAGIVTADELVQFQAVMKKRKDATPAEKKEAFQAALMAKFDSIAEDASPADKLKQLIKGIKDVLVEAAKDKGERTEPCEEDKNRLKENMKAHFSVPAQCPTHDDFSGDMMVTVKSIVGGMLVCGWKANGKPTEPMN